MQLSRVRLNPTGHPNEGFDMSLHLSQTGKLPPGNTYNLDYHFTEKQLDDEFDNYFKTGGFFTENTLSLDSRGSMDPTPLPPPPILNEPVRLQGISPAYRVRERKRIDEIRANRRRHSTKTHENVLQKRAPIPRYVGIPHVKSGGPKPKDLAQTFPAITRSPDAREIVPIKRGRHAQRYPNARKRENLKVKRRKREGNSMPRKRHGGSRAFSSYAEAYEAQKSLYNYEMEERNKGRKRREEFERENIMYSPAFGDDNMFYGASYSMDDGFEDRRNTHFFTPASPYAMESNSRHLEGFRWDAKSSDFPIISKQSKMNWGARQRVDMREL